MWAKITKILVNIKRVECKRHEKSQLAAKISKGLQSFKQQNGS